LSSHNAILAALSRLATFQFRRVDESELLTDYSIFLFTKSGQLCHIQCWRGYYLRDIFILRCLCIIYHNNTCSHASRGFSSAFPNRASCLVSFIYVFPR